MNTGVLSGMVVFLTGGASGIGYECAKAYLREGASVAVADVDISTLDEIIEEFTDKVWGISCDIADGKAVEKAIAETLHRYGKLDAVHNNAGITQPSKALHETTEEEWALLFGVNLKGIYFTTKFALDHLKKTKGVILNTSSMVGEIGQELHAAYSATKGGVNALTKSMALDYASFGIRVNAVSPAGVWTPALHKWAESLTNKDHVEDYLNKIHPLGYCPSGDVIADACVFLLSEKARFITGCIMPVSGGAELGYRR